MPKFPKAKEQFGSMRSLDHPIRSEEKGPVSGQKSLDQSVSDPLWFTQLSTVLIRKNQIVRSVKTENECLINQIQNIVRGEPERDRTVATVQASDQDHQEETPPESVENSGFEEVEEPIAEIPQGEICLTDSPIPIRKQGTTHPIPARTRQPEEKCQQEAILSGDDSMSKTERKTGAYHEEFSDLIRGSIRRLFSWAENGKWLARSPGWCPLSGVVAPEQSSRGSPEVGDKPILAERRSEGMIRMFEMEHIGSGVWYVCN